MGAAAVGRDAAARRDRQLHARGERARDGEPVRHELRIRPESSAPLCHADHWFYGSDGRLLATLEDVVGVGTQALNRLAAARA